MSNKQNENLEEVLKSTIKKLVSESVREAMTEIDPATVKKTIAPEKKSIQIPAFEIPLPAMNGPRGLKFYAKSGAILVGVFVISTLVSSWAFKPDSAKATVGQNDRSVKSAYQQQAAIPEQMPLPTSKSLKETVILVSLMDGSHRGKSAENIYQEMQETEELIASNKMLSDSYARLEHDISKKGPDTEKDLQETVYMTRQARHIAAFGTASDSIEYPSTEEIFEGVKSAAPYMSPEHSVTLLFTLNVLRHLQNGKALPRTPEGVEALLAESLPDEWKDEYQAVKKEFPRPQYDQLPEMPDLNVAIP